MQTLFAKAYYYFFLFSETTSVEIDSLPGYESNDDDDDFDFGFAAGEDEEINVEQNEDNHPPSVLDEGDVEAKIAYPPPSDLTNYNTVDPIVSV